MHLYIGIWERHLPLPKVATRLAHGTWPMFWELPISQKLDEKRMKIFFSLGVGERSQSQTGSSTSTVTSGHSMNPVPFELLGMLKLIIQYENILLREIAERSSR